jgi:hypothetical protein
MPTSETESLLVENASEGPIEGVDNPDEMKDDLDTPESEEKPEKSESAPKEEVEEEPVKEGDKTGEKAVKDMVKKTKSEKAVYTQEELEELLKSDADTVDTGRLTPEGKLLMKSFQRGFDQKFKGLSEQQKKLEQDKEAQASPKVQLFKRYLSDSLGVTKEINAEI